jgi:PEGA domain
LKVVKGMLALGGLILLVAALLVWGGALTEVVFKEDLDQLQKTVAEAQKDIYAATSIKSGIEVGIQRELRSGITGYKITVTYDFLPPGVDRVHLYRTAEAAVKAHFENVVDFKVTNIAAPTPLPPTHGGPGQVAVAPTPPAPVAPPPPEPDKKPVQEKGPPPDKKPVGGKGTITLFTIPPGALVTLKGKELGRTPLLKVPVPSGTQLFKLSFPDGKTKQLSAKISANELAKFKFNEDELPDG